MKRTILGLALLFCAAPGHGAATTVAHPTNAIARNEHEAMMDLVRVAEATATAVRSGNWSTPATWKEGRVPGAGAIVVIPSEIAVRLQGEAGALRAVRVEGTLRWETEASASLTVETLLVTPSGRLEMGTPQRPIAAAAAAHLVFSDSGPIDTGRDPFLMSRGLISHGSVSICGREVKPFAVLAVPPRAGDRVLHLAEIPTAWKKGDRLVLPAVHVGQADEELIVAEVQGKDVTREGLLLKPRRQPREGWVTAFRNSQDAGIDELADTRLARNEFDQKAWRW